MRKSLLGLAVTALAIGTPGTFAGAATTPPPHVYRNPSGYTLPANNTLPLTSLISKDTAVAEATGAGGQVVAAVLKTYDQFGKDRNIGVVNPEVSPLRIGWEVTTNYPNGIGNRGGTWGPNTKVITLLDAQTGHVLGRLTLGQRTSSGRHGRP